MRRSLVVAALVLLAVVGCSKKSEPKAAAKPPPNGMPPHGMMGGMMGGAQQPGEAPAPAAALKGKVLEKLDASVYSYLRLQTASGETWAAVPQSKTAVGADVEVVNPQRMDGFESKTLNRKFDSIVFGTLAGEAAPAAGGMAAMMQGKAQDAQPGAEDPKAVAARHAAVAAGPSDTPAIAVPKATGPDAKTVAEVWAGKAALKDKKITIHAQVVKATSGVMGRNWLHLRDGSGSPDKHDNDLTVTTSGTAAVGDVVTVSGKVATDRDFGAGYAYPVIVEEATVAK